MPRGRVSQYPEDGAAMAADQPFPMNDTPPLDPKDERLLYLSSQVGALTTQNASLISKSINDSERIHSLEAGLKQTSSQLDVVREEREEWKDKYWKEREETVRLRQYEPKENNDDEPKTS